MAKSTIDRVKVIPDGIFDNANKGMDQFIVRQNLIDANAKKIAKSLKDVEIAAARIKGDLLNTGKSNSAEINRTIQLTKEANAALQVQLKLKQQEIDMLRIKDKTIKEQQSAEQSLQRQRERSIAQNEKDAVKAKEAARAYKILEKSLSDAKRRYQDLAAAGLERTREARGELNNINQLRAKYEGLNKTIGNSQFAVGRYENALGKLGGGFRSLIGLAGQFGVTIGGIALARTVGSWVVQHNSLDLALRNVLKSNKDYEESTKFLSGLSKSYGQDLIVLTGAYKNFIASSESSQLPLEERNKIFESITKAGSSLALSNEQIEGSLLAVSQMFSKGTVSAEELRGQLGERLPGAFGIMAKSIGVSEAALGDLLKEGKVMAADVLPKFAVELDKAFGANAEKNLTTISGAFNVLKTNVIEYATEANKSNRVTERIAGAIKFLGQNIGLLVSIGGKLLEFFLIYKARLIAINVAQKAFGDGTGKLNVSLKQLKENLTGAEGGMKGFGNALKNVGWGLAIAGAFELGTELYRVVTGARLAEEHLKIMGFLNEKSDKQLRKRIDAIKEQNTIGKLTDSQAVESIKEIIKLKEQDQKLVQASYKAESDRLKLNDNLRTRQAMKDLIGLNQQYERELEVLNGELDYFNEADKERVSTMTKEQKKAFEDRLKALADYTKRAEDLEDEMLKNQQAREEQQLKRKLERELRAIEYNGIEANRLRIDLMLKYNLDVIEIQAKFDKIRIEKQKEYWDQVRDAQKEAGEKYVQQLETDLDQELSEYDRQQKEKMITLLKSSKTEEEINEQDIENQRSALKLKIKTLEDYGKDSTDLRLELAKLERDAEKARSDAEQKAMDDRMKRLKEESEYRQQLIDALVQFETDRIDKLIELKQKEIDASEKQSDYLQELAANGNIKAQQSLASENEIRAEAIKEEQRLQKQKAAIELAGTAVKILDANITEAATDNNDQTTTGTAFAKTLADVALLKGFLSQLSSFDVGADRLTEKGKGIDNKGGFLAINHPNEMIMTADENAAMGFRPRSEIVNIVKRFDEGQVTRLNEPLKSDSAGTTFDIKPIVDKLSGVENAIKNIPENNGEFGQLGQFIATYKQTRRSRGRTTEETYIIR